MMVMLYILRLLFAHNVNVKCRSLKLSGFFGTVPPPHQSQIHLAVAAAFLSSPSLLLYLCLVVSSALCCFYARTMPKARQHRNSRTTTIPNRRGKKKYASRTQTEMNNKLSRQMNKTEVNSKHFNVN